MSISKEEFHNNLSVPSHQSVCRWH